MPSKLHNAVKQFLKTVNNCKIQQDSILRRKIKGYTKLDEDGVRGHEFHKHPSWEISLCHRETIFNEQNVVETNV